jgi:hypothetical protein
MDMPEGGQWPTQEEEEFGDDYFDDEAMDEYLTALNQSVADGNAIPGGGTSESAGSQPAKADLRRKARELAEGAKRRRIQAKTKPSVGHQP